MRLKSFPKIYQLGIRFPKAVLFCSLLISLVSLFLAKELKLITNLTALLPKEAHSVQNLEKVKRYFGGTSFLIITVEGESAKLAKDFAEQFVSKLEKHPNIEYVDYHQPTDFLATRKWLYLNFNDLEEIKKRINTTVSLQKKGVSSVFSSFLNFSDKEEQPDLTFEDIFQKYKKRIGVKKTDTLTGEEGRFLILKVKTKENSENIEVSRKLIQEIRSMANDLKKENRLSGIQIGFTGFHQNNIEATDLMQKEIGIVSVIVSIALLLVLLIYFKKWSSPFLIGIPLTLSVLWTGGIVYLVLGHLNLVTGFAAAILGGLGSDYGIYLLTRYYYEREIGTSFSKACDLTFESTGRATYASMITTVGSFIALLFSDFGVFKELGFVGAIGLWMNYLTMMLILPSLLSLLEQYKTKKSASKNWNFLTSWRSIVQLHSSFLSRKNSFIGLLLVIFLCGMSAFSLPSQTKIQFEDGQFDANSLPSSRLSKRVNEVLQSSLSPTFILANGLEEERNIVHQLENLLENKPSSEIVFNNVVGLSSFIPENQKEKKVVLSEILEKADQIKIILKKQKEKFLESLKESLNSSIVSLENLPPEVKRKFISSQDKNYFGIYLFPSFGRTNWESISKYYNGVESLKQTIGINFIAADSSFVTYDVIRTIQKESSRGFFLILLFFLGVLFYTLRSFKRAFVIFLNLLGSLVVLSGAFWLFNIHLNILNIAVVPIVLGTGIDCFVHFSHHYEESGDIQKTLQTEIPAMFISSFTSLIGFAGLLFTSSAGLRSVGFVAVLGLSLVTLFCAFVFPRCLVLERKEKLLTSPSLEEDAVEA